jgi:diguanylate cyclase (GGDEF)-like protein
VTRDVVAAAPDVDSLVTEGRYGRTDVALRRVEALIPSLAQAPDTEGLMLALYGRALMLRQLGASTLDASQACDVLERAGQETGSVLWEATGCALRARVRVDAGDVGGATADLARADAALATEDLSVPTGYRLLDTLALVYARLRLHDRADEVRGRIEHTMNGRSVLERAQHWASWSCELASRAMEPVAGGASDPDHELLRQAVQLAAKLDDLPETEVPATLRRGARGVGALAAAYRGKPSEALRLLGPDAFGTVGDLPLVERQIVSLAAMRAHALVGSLATARSLDDAAATPPAALPHLVLEVCRTRERLWLETYAGGDVIPVLHRMTELLVRLGWRGMDLVADTARQALEHQALRTESRTDALTGVGNRRALDEAMRQLLRFSALPLALILVDVDHFKEVNDRFTHVVGDEVLRRVAASLQLQLRTDDRLLRYGGDEFVVLLPGTGDEEANAVAERMRAAVAARPWDELADGLQVTITTGVAAVWSLTGRRPDADAEGLFRRADERLLEGKRRRPGGAGRSAPELRGRSRRDVTGELAAAGPALGYDAPTAVVRSRALRPESGPIEAPPIEAFPVEMPVAELPPGPSTHVVTTLPVEEPPPVFTQPVATPPPAPTSPVPPPVLPEAPAAAAPEIPRERMRRRDARVAFDPGPEVEESWPARPLPAGEGDPEDLSDLGDTGVLAAFRDGGYGGPGAPRPTSAPRWSEPEPPALPPGPSEPLNPPAPATPAAPLTPAAAMPAAGLPRTGSVPMPQPPPLTPPAAMPQQPFVQPQPFPPQPQPQAPAAWQERRRAPLEPQAPPPPQAPYQPQPYQPQPYQPAALQQPYQPQAPLQQPYQAPQQPIPPRPQLPELPELPEPPDGRRTLQSLFPDTWPPPADRSGPLVPPVPQLEEPAAMSWPAAVVRPENHPRPRIEPPLGPPPPPPAPVAPPAPVLPPAAPALPPPAAPALQPPAAPVPPPPMAPAAQAPQPYQPVATPWPGVRVRSEPRTEGRGLAKRAVPPPAPKTPYQGVARPAAAQPPAPVTPGRGVPARVELDPHTGPITRPAAAYAPIEESGPMRVIMPSGPPPAYQPQAPQPPQDYPPQPPPAYPPQDYPQDYGQEYEQDYGQDYGQQPEATPPGGRRRQAPPETGTRHAIIDLSARRKSRNGGPFG